MQVWNSFLQTVFQFVKSLFVNVSKKMYRNAAVLATGTAVVTVVTFMAGDFGGGGRNALIAFAETPAASDEAETDLEELPAAVEVFLAAAESIPEEAEGKYTARSEQDKEEEANKSETETEPGPGAAIKQESDGETKDGTAKAADGEPLPEKTETGNTESGNTESGNTNPENTESGKAETEKAAARSAAAVLSDKDYGILLRIVEAEAGICDTKGRILVANVILNRVDSKEFPGTVTGVVYQRSQFSPVIDGSIDTCRVTQKTVEAVDRALAGEDYSEGALYFMNRKTSSKKNVRWFDNHLDYLFRHGAHEFFR